MKNIEEKLKSTGIFKKLKQLVGKENYKKAEVNFIKLMQDMKDKSSANIKMTKSADLFDVKWKDFQAYLNDNGYYNKGKLQLKEASDKIKSKKFEDFMKWFTEAKNEKI